MSPTVPQPLVRTPWTARVLALAVALVLAFVCLPGVVHAAGDQSDGCPQIKLEGYRLPPSFIEAAIAPVRLSLGEPPAPGWVAHPDGPVTPSRVVPRRASPRAPPTA